MQNRRKLLPYATALLAVATNYLMPGTAEAQQAEVYTKTTVEETATSENNVKLSLFDDKWQLAFNTYLKEGSEPDNSVASRVDFGKWQWYVFFNDSQNSTNVETKINYNATDNTVIDIGFGNDLVHGAFQYGDPTRTGFAAGYVRDNRDGEGSDTFVGEAWRYWDGLDLFTTTNIASNLTSWSTVFKEAGDWSTKYALIGDWSQGEHFQKVTIGPPRESFYTIGVRDSWHTMKDDRFNGQESFTIPRGTTGYHVPPEEWRLEGDGFTASYSSRSNTATANRVEFIGDSTNWISTGPRYVDGDLGLGIGVGRSDTDMNLGVFFESGSIPNITNSTGNPSVTFRIMFPGK